MKITKEEMDEINIIQLKIYEEFVNVCKILKLKYYLIHGSLLGAIRYRGFFPYDDDIDVAMPRKDYDTFISEGQKYLSPNLFIQSNRTERDYPLVFAKIRNNDTTFIQPILNKLDINKGIYIDVFPIDNYPNDDKIIKKLKVKERLYKLRLSSMLNTNNSIIKKSVITILSFVYPNKYKILESLNNLYKNIPYTGKIIIYGGKDKERGINYSLFSNGEFVKFEKINSSVPIKTI